MFLLVPLSGVSYDLCSESIHKPSIHTCSHFMMPHMTSMTCHGSLNQIDVLSICLVNQETRSKGRKEALSASAVVTDQPSVLK